MEDDRREALGEGLDVAPEETRGPEGSAAPEGAGGSGVAAGTGELPEGDGEGSAPVEPAGTPLDVDAASSSVEDGAGAPSDANAASPDVEEIMDEPAGDGAVEGGANEPGASEDGEPEAASDEPLRIDADMDPTDNVAAGARRDGADAGQGGVASGFLDAARTATQAGSRSINQGLSAMREVSQAKRAHAEARERLVELERLAQAVTDDLAHRREVEENYDDIVRVQSEEIADAKAAHAEAEGLEAKLQEQLDQRTGELKRLKAANEQRLSPYRELRDSAKGTLSDAERAHADAKRALKVAQTQADGASNARDTRVASANRAVDNAAARLQRLQDQFASMKRDPSTGAKEMSEMSGGVAAALAQLENARDDVRRVTAETTQAVEISQTHLYTQRKSLEEAQADLEAAQADEKEKRAEYDRLSKEASEAENELSKKADDLKSRLDQARQDKTRAQGRIEAAQALMEEAEDVHAHPEATRRLERELAEEQEEADHQRELVEALALEVHEVRERTHHARTTFVVIAVIVGVIVLLALWATLAL